jgi:hypothetical protein
VGLTYSVMTIFCAFMRPFVSYGYSLCIYDFCLGFMLIFLFRFFFYLPFPRVILLSGEIECRLGYSGREFLCNGQL